MLNVSCFSYWLTVALGFSTACKQCEQCKQCKVTVMVICIKNSGTLFKGYRTEMTLLILAQKEVLSKRGSFNKRLQGRGDKGSCPDVITHLASLPQTGGGPAWLPHKLFGKHSRANISSSSIFVTIIINICHLHHQYSSSSSLIFFNFVINIFHLHHQYFSPSSSISLTLVINICPKHHKKIQLKSIQNAP